MSKIYNNFKFGLGVFTLTLFSGSSLQAAGCLKQDCASLGYTKSEAECGAGIYVRCPFDSSKYFCSGCSSEYVSNCSGTGYIGGIGASCNSNFQKCGCATDYNWVNNKCVHKYEGKSCEDIGYFSSDKSSDYLECTEQKLADFLTCWNCRNKVKLDYRSTFTTNYPGGGTFVSSIVSKVTVKVNGGQVAYKQYTQSMPSNAGDSNTGYMTLLTGGDEGSYAIKVSAAAEGGVADRNGKNCQVFWTAINGKCWGGSSGGPGDCPAGTEVQPGNATGWMEVGYLRGGRSYVVEVWGVCFNGLN